MNHTKPVRLFAVSTVLLALAASIGAAGCAGPSADPDTESGSSDVVVERGRLDELAVLAKQAKTASTSLGEASIAFVGVKDSASVKPVFASATALTAALKPLIQKLEERLERTPPEELRRAGFLDVPDREYRGVIEIAHEIGEVLSTELPRASESVQRAPSGPNLTEDELLSLRVAVGEYADLITSVATEVSGIAAQIQDWLKRSSAPRTVIETKVALKIVAWGPLGSTPELWETECRRQKAVLATAFPKTLSDVACAHQAVEKSVTTDDYYFTATAGEATFRAAGDVDFTVLRIQGDVSEPRDVAGAFRSWSDACQKAILNVQDETLDGRVVVGAVCGEPKDSSPTVGRYQFKSIGKMLTTRRP